MGPPGQPWARRLRLVGCFLLFFSSALVEPVAVAVHFQDMDMVGEAVEKRAGQAFGAEHLGPLVEGEIAGHQGGAALIALAEHLEQEFGTGLG